MRYFVTGASGMLGHAVVYELLQRGHEVIGCGRSAMELAGLRFFSLDLTDYPAVRTLLADVRPDAIIHCAAWTDVDAAEAPKNQDAVQKINTGSTRCIAQVCKTLHCKMLYLSTDYVFDGTGTAPWHPDTSACRPLNYYGKTKADGELAVREILEQYYIVRTSWSFGAHGRNFVSTMLQAGKTHSSVRVVCDQIGTPTYTTDLARLLVDLCETDRYGIYHAANTGEPISWYEFCCECFRQYGLSTPVIPVTTEEYGLCKAPRPRNSRLDTGKLTQAGFLPLPHWQDALSRYLKEAQL